LLTADGSKLMADIHIERGTHGVLTKNKILVKNFYSLPYNNLPQKIPCGRTPIFARRAHIRAYGRGTLYPSLKTE
jgi:hypothetical protein